ncbi:hypothetical protein ACFLTB_04480 [Chloroflexota bacterium]
MKLKTDAKGNVLIQPENQAEEQQIEGFKKSVIQALPQLKKLWAKDLVLLSDLSDTGVLDGETVIFTRTFSFGKGKPIAIRLKGVSGRPLNERTLNAALKLLTGAPFEMVLNQEKQWRTNEYLNKVRDKSVQREINKAHNSAIRDADMCLKRAEKSVSNYLKKNDGMLLLHAIMQTVIREQLGVN